MSARLKNAYILLGVLIFIIIATSVLYIFPPNEVVDIIGVHNSYWVTFLIAAIAGVSTLTSTSYYATIITFAIGGAHPVLLGICAGIGMSIGDSLFYYLGKRGRKVLPDTLTDKAVRFESWLASKPQWAVPLFVYLYDGFTPFPGDILAIFLGITRFRYKQIIVPIILGNITLMTIIASVAANS